MTLSHNTDLHTTLITIYVFVDDMQDAILESIRPLLTRPTKGTPPIKKHKLSVSEIATLAIFRFYTGHRNWKDFYNHIKTYHQKDFPNLPTYQNFIAAIDKLACFSAILLQGFMHFFRTHTHGEATKFVDGSKLKVCEITRSLSHKVAKDYATKSKTHTGWFYGFRLHIIVNEWMEILGCKIASGSKDERKVLASMWDNIIGMIVADAGYIGKQWAEKAKEGGKVLFAAVRANMKKLMTKAQHALLKERQKVEIVFSVLKLRFGIENTLPRSIQGYLAHYLWALTAYQLKKLFDGRKNALSAPSIGSGA